MTHHDDPIYAVSIGGSILVPGDDDLSYIQALTEVLKKVAQTKRLIIVVGGGKLARNYQSMARGLGAGNTFLDEIGIAATRLNAKLLMSGLGHLCHPIVVETLDEAAEAIRDSRIIVAGGTHPGHTTDAVTAMMAEKLRADVFINATSVDGVYTSDPNKDPEAKRIETISYAKLLEIVAPYAGKPGANVVMDPLAVKVLARSKMTSYVVKGRDLDNLKLALEGSTDVHGTVINPD